MRIGFTDVGVHRYGNRVRDRLVPYIDATGVPWEYSDDPELVFVGFNGEDYRRYDCLRVILPGENVRPNFDEFDFSLGVDFLDDPRHFRLPFGHGFFPRLETLIGKPPARDIARGRTNFCNFVYANPHPPERIRMFRLLSRYRRVDSFGPVLNNMPFEPHAGERYAPDWGALKRRFQARYRFSIAFESESSPGYVSEKICDAMAAGTIPVYWGSPRIAEDFNPRSFINCHDYGSLEEAVERVIEIDGNEALYLEMLAEPWFPNDRVPDRFAAPALTGFLRDIFLRARDLTPVARQPDARARAASAPSPALQIRMRHTPWQWRYRRLRYIAWPALLNRLRRGARHARQGHWNVIRRRILARGVTDADRK